MARLKVIQVRCDRCKRVQLMPPPPEGQENRPPDFKAEFDGKLLQYDDVCVSCKETLNNLWKDLAEWEREVKQSFGPKLDCNQAAPVTPAPDYTPPKPYSAASLKK